LGPLCPFSCVVCRWFSPLSFERVQGSSIQHPAVAYFREKDVDVGGESVLGKGTLPGLKSQSSIYLHYKRINYPHLHFILDPAVSIGDSNSIHARRITIKTKKKTGNSLHQAALSSHLQKSPPA